MTQPAPCFDILQKRCGAGTDHHGMIGGRIALAVVTALGGGRLGIGPAVLPQGRGGGETQSQDRTQEQVRD